MRGIDRELEKHEVVSGILATDHGSIEITLEAIEGLVKFETKDNTGLNVPQD